MEPLIEKAYRTIGNLTPIPADCGRLCSRSCCGGGLNAGMLLFPGERELLDSSYRIKREKLGMLDVDFAVCRGKCLRVRRPLSCRIYPFAPFISDGVLRIIPDARAAYRCPLLLGEAKEFISAEFLNALERVFTDFCTDPEMFVFLQAFSDMQSEYMRFTKA